MITRIFDYFDFAARALRAEAEVQRLRHLPRALEMCNERADRWKQRYDEVRAELDALKEES